MTKWCYRGLFLVPAMVMVTFGVYSQRKSKFSTIEFGVGPSVTTIFDNDGRTSWSPKLSGSVGMGLVYAVKRNLSVTVHAMLERKGAGLNYGVDGVESAGDKYNITSTYISLTPGVRRYIGDSGFFVEGGAFVAFLLDSKATPVHNRARPRAVGPFTTFDAGISGSLGLVPYRTKFKGWNFRLVNNLGLADANHLTGTKELSNSLALIIGMRMRMR